MSKRMGTSKQLVKVNGKCLLQWVVEAALESSLHRIYLVLGCNAENILNTLPQFTRADKVIILNNTEHESGLSSSIQCGVLAAQDHFENLMFMLGDQPFFSARLINLLLQEHEHSGKNICAPTFQNRRGNPVLFNKIFYGLLLNVEGDKGGRTVLRDHPAHIHTVVIDDPIALYDVDTTEDLDSLRRHTDVKSPFHL